MTDDQDQDKDLVTMDPQRNRAAWRSSALNASWSDYLFGSHEDANNGDQQADNGENYPLLDHNFPNPIGYETLCNCWKAIKLWCTCLNDGQGHMLLSFQYFLVMFAVGVALTFAHTSNPENTSDMGNTSNNGRSSNDGDSDTSCVVYTRLAHLEGFITFLLCLSILGMIMCLIYRGYFVGRCCNVSTNEDNYLMKGVLIFGFVSTVWYILRLIDEEMCRSTSLIDVLHSAMEIFFILMEIYFLSVHKTIKFNNSCLIKIILMQVMATNFSVWFRITAGEAVDRHNEMPDICTNISFHKLCFSPSSKFPASPPDKGNSSLTHLLRTTMPVLYPCITEFYLSASALFLKMWLFPSRNQGCNADNNHQERQPQPRTSNRFIKSLPVFIILIGAVSVVCILMYVIHPGKNSLVIPFMYDITQLIVTICVLAFSIIGIATFAGEQPNHHHEQQQPEERQQQQDEQRQQQDEQRQQEEQPEQQPQQPNQQNAQNQDQNHNPDHKQEVMIEGALLMISLFALYTAQGLELAALLDSNYLKKQFISKNYHGICGHMLNTETATRLFTLLTCTLQAIFIIKSLNAKPSEEERNQNREAANNIPYRLQCRYLTAQLLLWSNLALWLTKTFELSGLYCNPLYYMFYKPWLQLTDILYPLWIFFHFHSAASCYEISSN